MDMADFYEELIDHIAIRRCHWIFDHGDYSPEVEKVFNWLLDKEKEALHTARHPDGKSFYQRREEQRAAKSKKEGEAAMYKFLDLTDKIRKKD